MGLIILGLFLGIAAVVANFVIVASANDSYDVRRGNKEKIKVSVPILVISFLVPVLLTLFITSTKSVGTGEIAVMTRFGRVTGQELGEGFHFKNPIDKANVYDIKVQKEEAQAAAASKDLQDVNSTLVINYNLQAGSVDNIHREVGKLYKEKLIDPSVQEVVKSSTAQYDATTLITQRPQVKKTIEEALRARLEKYGIEVNDVAITNLEFSPEFTNAIESKQVEQQKAERAKFISQRAREEAQARIEKARGEAEAQRLQQQTLTPLLVQKLFLETWDGKLPVVTGGGGNILDVNSLIQARN